MKLTKKTIVALLVAVVAVLAVGGATLALAAPAVLHGWPPGWGRLDGNRGGVVGTVQSVNDSQLILTAADSKTITVTVTSQTQVIVMPGRTTGKMADIKVGDTVHVAGKLNPSGALEAQTIAVGVGAQGERLAGQVTAVDGTRITLQVGQTTQTMVTDASTKFFVAGGQAGTLADVKKDVYVMALAQKQTDGSLLATQVMIGVPGSFGRGRGMGGTLGQFGDDENRVGGQVTAVDGAKITLQMGRPVTQTQTIITDANTRFFVAGGQAGTLADVKTGELVMAQVQKQTDGSLLATQVMVGTQGGFGRGMGGMMEQPFGKGNRVGGQVTAVDGAKITVQMGQSTQIFVTDANTKFFVAGGQAGSLTDVKTGEYVMAQVQKQADGSWLATQVAVVDQTGTGPGGMWNPGRRHGPGGRPTPLVPGANS